MKILLTGAFGNIGMSTLPELVRQGHRVRCFVRKRRSHEDMAQRFSDNIEIIYGDIRKAADVAQAVQDQDVIIHLAYMLPPYSEEQPDLARSINIDGTRHLLVAACTQPTPPRFLFASSLDVFGYTQDQLPPRTVTDPVLATDHYSTHKIACEEMVKTSGLEWAIFRFADVPPLTLRKPHPIMFRIPLTTRIEVIHTYDAGLAVANGMRCEEIWGKILLIGGGASCQVVYRDYVRRMLMMMGIGILPESAFATEPYNTDWLDTEESQRMLNYQRYSFDDIIQHLARIIGYKRLLTVLVSPVARWWILRMSPYYRG